MNLYELAIVVAGTAITAALGIKRVPPGQAWIVERQGRYIRTLSSGVTWIVPTMDRVVAKIALGDVKLDIPRIAASTLDNRAVTIAGSLAYEVLDAAKAVYEVADLKQALLDLAHTSMKKVAGEAKFHDLLGARSQVAALVLPEMARASEPWGVRVSSFTFTDAAPA